MSFINIRLLFRTESSLRQAAKVAYKNMADAYTTTGEYDSAFYYLHVLTTAGTKDAEVWSNLADIYVMRKGLSQCLDRTWQIAGHRFHEIGNLPEAGNRFCQQQ